MKSFVLFLITLITFAAGPLWAAVYKVTSTADNVEGVTTSGHAGTLADPYLAPSLRSAVISANTAVANTIIFDASLNGNPITLSRAGLDNGGLIGDIDVTSPFTIQGNGPNNTIIQAGSSIGLGVDKIFSFNPQGTLNGFAVTISGVTLRYGRNASNNNATDGEGGAFDFHAGPNHTGSLVVTNCVITGNSTINGDGGAVALFDGGSVTFTNCAVTNNTANSSGAVIQGGAIFVGCATLASTLNISGCTFSGNTANGTGADGGALYILGACAGSPTLTYGIHHCAFSGNHAANDGGAIRSSAPLTIDSAGGLTTFTGNSSGRHGGALWLNGPTTLSTLTITGNTASGNGGGIHGDTSIVSLNISYSRFVGNTATNGSAIFTSGGTITTQNNWWGTNSSPASMITGTANFNPWLMLRHYANPASISVNGSSTLTATFLTNSTPAFVPASNLGVLVGLPISFASPVRGTIFGAQSAIQASGTATASFTAGSSSGAGGVNATVDNATATASITVTCPAVSGGVSGGGTVCAGTSANVTVTITGGTPPYNITLNNGGGSKIGSSPIAFTLTPSSTTTYSLSSGTDNNGCPISGSGSATITVNPLPSTPTFALSPASICSGSTGNSASGPAGMASYSWTISNGTISSSANAQTITYTSGGSGTLGLQLTVSNGSGCSATGSTNIPINPLPSTPVISGTPSSPCADSAGNVATAPPGYSSYVWGITNGLITSPTNIQTITYSAGSDGNLGLTVLVKNASGCSAIATTNLSISPAPHPSPIAATPTAPCANSSGNTASTSSGIQTYSWTITNGVITSGTNLQSITYNAGPAGDVGLKLVTQGPSGCTATTITNIPITPFPNPPFISLSSSNVCAGFASQASGPAGFASYAWTISNGSIVDATNLQTINFVANSPGDIILGLSVQTAAGCGAASSTNVTVGSVVDSPAIVATPSPVCPGSVGNQATTGSNFTQFAWTIANGVITSATNTRSITYTAGASGDVHLQLVVRSPSGCTAAVSKNVPIQIDTTPPTIFCPSDIIITAFGNCPARVAFDVSAIDDCAVSSITANPPQFSAFPLGTNTVVVTATDTSGNTNNCEFKVIVLSGPPPQLEISRKESSAVLSWPEGYGCYTLQSSSKLLSSPATNVWLNYTGPLVTNRSRVYATNGISSTNQFYRLAH